MTAATATRFTLRPATLDNCASLTRLISVLAEYEKLTHLVRITPGTLAIMSLGPRPCCEVVLAEVGGQVVGFALFFHNFSTFLCKPGLYLEDLFIEPEYRGLGINKALLIHLACLAQEWDCGRFEWNVLDRNAPPIVLYEAVGTNALPEWCTCRAISDALTKLAVTVMSASLAVLA